MPIYEYHCLKCRDDFETLVLRKDDPVTCPKCDGRKVERLLSACAFKSSNSFTPSKGSSSCASCSSGNCSSCH